MLITFSTLLRIQDKRHIGLYDEVRDLSLEGLGIGIVLQSFHSLGQVTELKKLFIMFRKIFIALFGSFRSNSNLILSVPADELLHVWRADFNSSIVMSFAKNINSELHDSGWGPIWYVGSGA